MYADVEKTQDVQSHERELRRMRDEMARGAQQAVGTMPMRQITDREIVAELFSYHPPTEITLPKFAAINQAAKNFAEIVLANCPPSADRSACIRQIREARMTANAAIALNGLSL